MEDTSVTFRKIGNFKRTVIRKRELSTRKDSSTPSTSSESDLEKQTSLVVKRKQLRQKNMICTTSKKRKRELDNLKCLSSSSEVNEEDEFDISVKFASSNTAELEGPKDMGATARSEIDTEHGKDAQAQFERIQKILKEKKLDTAVETSNEKIYKGMALYGAKEKSDTVKGNASSGLNRIGPIRATQYMRSTVRWDYAPDICKDYKETGYCTFGDSCKFMHDRSDYKHGWQLEREWEQQKLKETKEDEYLVSSEADDSDDCTLPFKCFICREPFKNPIVTKCKHYFCEICVLKRCKKTQKCAVCNFNTNGQFKVAKEIIERTKLQKNKTNEDETLLDNDVEQKN